MLPDANFLSSRAQNRGFCAFLAFGTPDFGKRLRDYVLTPFDDPSTFVKKGFEDGRVNTGAMCIPLSQDY